MTDSKFDLSAYESSNSWPAPAKINLFLHVTAKRQDGYHDLQTVFAFLGYGDQLEFEVNNKGVIERTYDFGFDEASDLCLRAAHALANTTKEMVGASIGMKKVLPMGGGLGGGSSNAATVLIALNHLWALGLSRTELMQIGAKLGADVPVFIYGQSAWAEGVGEQLSALILPETWFLVVNPKINVSTAAIFANKHLTPRPQMMKIRAFREADPLQFGENQLEPIVRANYPEVEQLFRWLSSYGTPRMSGSGGAVFLPVESQEQGLTILRDCPSNSTGFVAKSMNFHPLYRVDR